LSYRRELFLKTNQAEVHSELWKHHATPLLNERQRGAK